MSVRQMTQLELLQELSGVAEENVNRHLAMTRDWNPHDYIPWDEGRNFAELGGDDWDLEQSQLGEVARAAMITNLLTEDNLPGYHREIADYFSTDHAWGHWVGRWTAEENRHSIALRDYLLVTRSVDPVKLEEARMVHMSYPWGPAEQVNARVPEAIDMLNIVSYVTFQELATRVSHRNTGKACNEPIADKLLQRIAADENLHMIFYRNLCAAGLDLVPDQAIKAIADTVMNFAMPGSSMPDFRRHGVLMAKHGIYDLRQHKDEVVMPILRKWNIFERTDFGAAGEQIREELAEFLVDLEKQAVRFEEMRDRSLAREARKRELAKTP